MKKVYANAIACVICSMVSAQTPYPAAPPAPGQVTAIEYFFSNVDFGGGNMLTVCTSSADISSFSGTIDLSSLQPGLHRVFFRSKDATGKWSLAANSFFDNFNVPVYATTPAPVSITALEYFIDNMQNFGSGTAVTVTPSPDISGLNTSVDLTGSIPGIHRIYFRARDANGKWSLANNALFDNFNVAVYNAAPAPVTNIVQLEYFIDGNDAGFGNCMQIPITPGTDISGLNVNIDVTGLTPGVHRLLIRSKNADNKWSITNLSVFDNSAIQLYPLAPVLSPAVNALEYYIDTDPGFGNATQLTVPGNTGDISNYSVNVNLSGSLSTGTHYLYIRSSQSPWSVTSAVAFNATGAVPLHWDHIKAQLINGRTKISWATFQEINTDSFYIEHSTDGRAFSMIGKAKASGNSTSVSRYEHIHENPVKGFNYYRIKQTDLDGRFEYSVIVKVLNLKDSRETIIAPNPVTDMLHVAEPSMIFINSLEVYDTKGSLIVRKDIGREVQVYSLPVNELKSGQYILRITDRSGTRTYRFIRQ